ncbi:MAG: acyltransferase [Nitrospira sp.]
MWFFTCAYPGFTIGRNPKVWGAFSLQLMEGGRMEVGDDFHLVSEPRRSAITQFSRGQFTVFPGGVIRLGNHVGLNGTALTAKRRIEIGDNTMIAANVIIIDSDFHAKWPPELRWTTSTKEFDEDVIIGRNVWIGMNTVVQKGSRIGDNSIIGAGSMVRGEIPANCLAAGNPARVISMLGPVGNGETSEVSE